MTQYLDPSEMSNHVIQTYSGHPFDYDNPENSCLDIEDVARSLSFTCRFRGHTRFFYSVAQHCLELSKRLSYDPTLSLWGLLHEYGETYTGDNPSPLKATFPEIKKLEERILKQAINAYGLPWPMPQIIKDVDRRLLVGEAKILLRGALIPQWDQYFVGVVPYKDFDIDERPMGEVEARFLSAYHRLKEILCRKSS